AFHALAEDLVPEVVVEHGQRGDETGVAFVTDADLAAGAGFRSKIRIAGQAATRHADLADAFGAGVFRCGLAQRRCAERTRDAAAKAPVVGKAMDGIDARTPVAAVATVVRVAHAAGQRQR